jgi:micrococcal nuclease
MKRLLLIFAIIFVFFATYFLEKYPNKLKTTPLEASSSEITNVTYVFDGDTIEVTGGRRVRYIGMNAPEIAHPGQKEECFGVIATNENKSLVSGKTVRLVSDVADKDKYGRLLRYVYVGNVFVNDFLTRQGYAVAEPIKPDTLLASEFFSAQQEAKTQNRGLWNACP